MRPGSVDDRWAAGDAYEDFMGRWSRLLTQRFVHWLGHEPGLSWLDVGCGTGALASRICEEARPSTVAACDPSASFIEYARSRTRDPRVSFMVAGAEDLPEHPGGFDRVVSSLVLNFVPNPDRAAGLMRDRTRPGGVVAAAVWDYAGAMEFLRIFWDEAAALDPAASNLDEGVRFPLCSASALESLFRRAGLEDVACEAIEIATRFESFADYWRPFEQGTGPAPSYVASLDAARAGELRTRLERRLGPGTIDLVARAWAVRGTAP